MAKKFQFDGQTFELPDDVTDDEALAFIGSNSAPAQPELSDAGRVGGLVLRTLGKGAVSGYLGLSGLLGDAGINAAYGAKKLAAKTGLVDEPNPENYYRSSDKETYFPITRGIMARTDEAADAAKLPRPETPAETMATGVGEAVVGSLTGSGVGSFLARMAAGTAAGKAGSILAARPALTAAGAGTGAAVTGGINALDGDQKLPGWVAPAAGLAAGIVAPSAIEGARTFFGHVPGYGRVSSTSKAGQEAIANQIVQDTASDPAVAARNLRNTSADEARRTAVGPNGVTPGFVAPGYEEITTNAAQDTGLAAASSFFRDKAGGRIGDRLQSNNSALNRAFVNEGAGEGMAQAVRDQAAEGARRDLPRFGLTGSTAGMNEPIEITAEIQRLRRATQGNRPGTTSATRDVNAEAARGLEAVAERRRIPVTDASGRRTGTRIEYWATPERLQSFRSDLSESLAPPKGTATLPVPSAARARGETGLIMGRVDDTIGANVDAIPGPQGTTLEYGDYLARQRGLRTEADERSFMRALMEDVAPRANPVTGAQEFNLPKMSRIFNERNANRAIPGSQSGTMNVNRLSPARQGFLREMEELAQRGSFNTSAGTTAAGSQTARTMASEAGIANTIREAYSPAEKTGEALSRYIPFAGVAGRFLGPLYRKVTGEQVSGAVKGVSDRLGEFETNREAAISMLTGRRLPERGVGVAARRQGGVVTRGAVQGFLAGQRQDVDDRRRERRFR